MGVMVEQILDRSAGGPGFNQSDSDFGSGRLVAPDDEKVNRSIPILVTILGYSGVDDLLSGFGHEVIVSKPEVFCLFPEALRILTDDGFIWRQAPRSVQIDQIDDSSLRALRLLLVDDKSKQVCDSLMRFRQCPFDVSYPGPDTHGFYFPPDVPLYSGDTPVSIIDCGAFTGDTLISFLSRLGPRVRRYAAVEPSPANALKLRAVVSTLVEMNPTSALDVQVFNIAVGDRNGVAVVREDGPASNLTYDEFIGTRHGDSDSGQVLVTTLDGLFAGEEWSVLKMDIEGSEYEALTGARGIISRGNTTLAIAIYHKPQDLWRIPLLIATMAPEGYDYYLRQEGHWGLETTLYAVPKGA